MPEPTNVSESPTLAEAVGRNVTRIRTQRGLSVADFATRMHDVLGRGWQRQEAYKYERGDRAMTAEELMAAALVLGCTVGELTSSGGSVRIGTRTVTAHELDDSLSRASAEVEGWQRFQEAGEALNDLRHAAARYVAAIGYVRARVEVSPALRKRIQRFGKQSTASLQRQLTDYADPGDPPATDRKYLNANATPAMVVADDALNPERGVLQLTWLWRRRAAEGAN